jgi:phosphohistidine swiveling domain-containing protein
MNVSREEYSVLFKMQGRLTCLHSEFLVLGSLGIGGALVLCKEHDWRSFIRRDGEQLCLEKGLEVFSNEHAYTEYSDGFRAYIRMANDEIIPRFTEAGATITKDEFQKLLPILGKFWYYYGMTEFSYHDRAYEKLLETHDPVLKKNLDDLSSLKFEGRELLNALVFEHGVLHAVLRDISRQFLKHESDGVFLFGSELLALFDGWKVPMSLLDERKQNYGCVSSGGALQIMTLPEAVHAWGECCDDTKERTSLTGTIAQRGVASGRVVIAPMLVHMGEVHKIDMLMQKGDILVAESTTPELMMLCKKAAAIVTDQGGMLSHAAIVSRELKIPCIIGTGDATHVLKNGDLVEVDADKGQVLLVSRSDDEGGIIERAGVKE